MRSAFFLFVVGFMMVAFGVGGVEQSLTDFELLISGFVALVGLLVMWCGTLMLRVERDRPVDNSALW